MSQEVQNPARSAVPQDEVYAELELLVQSAVFKRSEKLQQFLRFVCETTVQGGGSQINEYLIGSKVFKRGSDYNPSEDSVVRRHAHTMRQKLQEYYATEGVDHAIRIEMPLGRYVPVFRRKEDLDLERPPEPAPPPPRKRFDGWRWALAAAAIVAVGWTILKPNSSPHPGLTAATREVWGEWIGNDAVLCFSNPMAGLVRHYTGPLSPDLPAHSFRADPDQELAFREKFNLPSAGVIYISPTSVQTMMGEAIGGAHVASLFGRIGATVHTTENRFLSWQDLKRENHVLFAGDVGNRMVDAILAKYPFRLAGGAGGSPRSIVNTAAKPGEESTYRVAGTNDVRDEYALISMLPGLGSNRQMLLICGLNSPATPLATEYLTTEQGMLQVLKRLHEAAPKHSGAWHFQAVIMARVHDKVPTTASIVSVRVL